MHNCPDVQEKLFDYVLNELGTAEQARLWREIAACPLCEAEKASIEKTLALYDQAAEYLEPRSHEWQAFEASILAELVPPKRRFSRLWGGIFSKSIRVPVPALAFGALALIAAVFFALRPTKQETIAVQAPPETPAPIIIEKPAPEKVVIQERVVTKKVYIEKRQNEPAKVRRPENANFSPLNLAEFKPVKPSAPTVVKGDAADEK
jgi:anti-sigma factor RsiW